MKEVNKMKQTILILMVSFVAVTKGIATDFDFKNVNSNTAQHNQVTSNRSQNTIIHFNQDYIDESNQGTSDSVNEKLDVVVNPESEKTDSSNKEESEQPRSEMIAGAMGIGIF
jgi:hypothetical protein